MIIATIPDCETVRGTVIFAGESKRRKRTRSHFEKRKYRRVGSERHLNCGFNFQDKIFLCRRWQSSPCHVSSRRHLKGSNARFETSCARARTVPDCDRFCAHLVRTNRRPWLQNRRGRDPYFVPHKEVLPLRRRGNARFTGFPVFCILRVDRAIPLTHTRQHFSIRGTCTCTHTRIYLNI